MVERDNHYESNGTFIPGHLFVATITSVVYLEDIGETAYIRSENLNLVVGKLYAAEKLINHW